MRRSRSELPKVEFPCVRFLRNKRRTTIVKKGNGVVLMRHRQGHVFLCIWIPGYLFLHLFEFESIVILRYDSISIVNWGDVWGRDRPNELGIIVEAICQCKEDAEHTYNWIPVNSPDWLLRSRILRDTCHFCQFPSSPSLKSRISQDPSPKQLVQMTTCLSSLEKATRFGSKSDFSQSSITSKHSRTLAIRVPGCLGISCRNFDVGIMSSLCRKSLEATTKRCWREWENRSWKTTKCSSWK